MARVRTEKEFGEAIKNGEPTIEIEGDLANKTIRLRATGTVAWAIAFAAIGISASAAIIAVKSRDPKTTTISGAVAFAAAPVAVGTLGASVSTTALAIAVAAGGVGALSKVRSYEEVERTDGRLILRKKV